MVEILHKYENAHDECLVYLGCCYYYGYGVPSDYEKVAQYILTAKEKGIPEGQTVWDNWGKLLKRLFEPAEYGNTEYEYRLGISYWYGCGVEKNNVEATKWMKYAAKDGHKKAIEFIINHAELK